MTRASVETAWRRSTGAILEYVISRHLALLRRVTPRRPYPLPYWLVWRGAVRLVTRKSNPIFPPYESLRSSVRVPELKDLMKPLRLGHMAMDAGTIDFIWTLLRRDAPGMIVEFGSGASTLALARFASLMRATGRECDVLSIEQSAEFRERTEEVLRRAGLKGIATIAHVPLDAESHYERTVLVRAFGLLPRPADFVVIDGPFGPPGCRVGTLPSLAPYTRDGARWILDDAFRDGELAIVRHWLLATNITLRGIYPIGKGLGMGFTKADPLYDVSH